MKVKIKKLHPDAVIPTYSKEGDAGMDLTAVSISGDEKGNIVYKTGIAMEIPKGYVGLIFPRSSVSNYRLTLANSVGVIDSGYRGEIMFKFRPTLTTPFTKDLKSAYDINERVGQLIILPYPQIEFEETDKLSETLRGDGGYGSTGN